jgi:hypothetical protein
MSRAAIIGSVPLYEDFDTGEVFVDPDDAEESTEVGAFGDRRRARRINRLDRRMSRLGDRYERLGGSVEEAPDYEYPQEKSMQAAPADVYQAAAASGMINENQYNGLGWISIGAMAAGVPTAGALQDTINRNLWGKSLVLDADSASQVIVTGISVAGLPVNVGAQGAPLSMFEKDSTRFGISFGRRLALTGQTFRVDLANIDAGSAHVVTGGIIADELNPYAMQRWMEIMLLQAAQTGFQGPGF